MRVSLAIALGLACLAGHRLHRALSTAEFLRGRAELDLARAHEAMRWAIRINEMPLSHDDLFERILGQED